MLNSSSTSRRHWNVSLVAVFFFFTIFNNNNNIVVVKAQETPSIDIELFSTTTQYRQNVCDRHDLYYSGQVPLRDALQGLELRPMIRVQNLFPLDGQNGTAINPDDPGLIAVLLDELGKRAGFEWRNSFAVNHGPGERSYTDFLVWATETFDIACDWYYNSLERLKLGVGFPRGFYDGSYILVGKLQSDNYGAGSDDHQANLFSLLRPFKPAVWWTIIGTVLASAVVYMVLENINRQVKHQWALGRNIFYSMMLFTQHFQFHPKSHAARMFAVSLAFWSLVIIATYTANLASFFVVQSAPVSPINGIQDVIRDQLPICVPDGWGSSDFVMTTYPNGVYVLRETEVDCFQGVTDGDCDFALTSVRSWEQYERDRSINGECDLAWLGRIISFIDAGFGVKSDAGVLCTSLIQDVLNVHLVEMLADGFIDRAWQDFRRRHQDIDCNVEGSARQDQLESQKLSLSEMSGTFFLHFLGIILALVITVVRKWRFEHYHREKTNTEVDDMSDDLNSVSDHDGTDGDVMDHENEEAVSVLEMQLKEYWDNQRAMERHFYEDLQEQQEQISALVSLLQNIQKDKATTATTKPPQQPQQPIIMAETTIEPDFVVTTEPELVVVPQENTTTSITEPDIPVQSSAVLPEQEITLEQQQKQQQQPIVMENTDEQEIVLVPYDSTEPDIPVQAAVGLPEQQDDNMEPDIPVQGLEQQEEERSPDVVVDETIEKTTQDSTTTAEEEEPEIFLEEEEQEQEEKIQSSRGISMDSVEK